MGNDSGLAKARAAVDQRLKLIKDFNIHMIGQAHELLEHNDPTTVWAALTMQLKKGSQLAGEESDSLAEVLAAMYIDQAQRRTSRDEPGP
jgi:hypothetical protein